MSDFLKDWMVIVNPNAGSGKGGKLWPSISKMLLHEGFAFIPRFTTAPLEATRFIMEAAEAGTRKFIIVGGDGTFHEAANGILLQKVVAPSELLLAVLPVGTGNDWSRMYEIPANPHQAVNIILKDQEYIQDVCRVSYSTDTGKQNRFFINLAGIGFDAEVVRRTNLSKQKGTGGKLLYFWHLLAALISLKTTEIHVRPDEGERIGKFFSISIGLCRYKGGGMMTAPQAIPNDGLLDVTLISAMGRLEIIRSLPLLFNGKIGTHKKVSLLRTKSAEVSSDDRVYLEADGELLGFTPVNFELIPSALRILVGRLPE
ncbi:MAG: diacylglycerol kinase family protein [Bacteroidales bacterium]